MPDSNHEKEGSDAAADCDDGTVLETSPSYFQVPHTRDLASGQLAAAKDDSPSDAYNTIN